MPAGILSSFEDLSLNCVCRSRSPNGVNVVNYTLYRDAARTQLWGTTIGTDTVAGTGAGADQTLTIYARTPTQTVPPPGVYTDAVTITITY